MGYAQEVDSRTSAMENLLSDQSAMNTALGNAFALSDKAKNIARRGLRRQVANTSKAQNRTKRKTSILNNLDKYLDRDETDTTTTTETGSSAADISVGSSGNTGGNSSDVVRRRGRMPPRMHSTSVLEDDDVKTIPLIDQRPVPMRSSSTPCFPPSLDLSTHSQPSLRRPSRAERKASTSKEEGSLSLSSHEVGSASKAIRSKRGYALPKKHQSLSSRKATAAPIEPIPTRTSSYSHRSAGIGLKDFINANKFSVFPQLPVGDVSVSSAPALQTSRRRGLQRRGSVTKYSLEDTQTDSNSKDASQNKPSTTKKQYRSKTSRRHAVNMNESSIESTQHEESSTVDPTTQKTKRSTKRSNSSKSKPRSRRSTPLQRQQGTRKTLGEGLKSLDSSEDHCNNWSSQGGEASVASEPALQGRGRHDRRRYMRRGGSASISTDSIGTMKKEEKNQVVPVNKTLSSQDTTITGEQQIGGRRELLTKTPSHKSRRRGGAIFVSSWDPMETASGTTASTFFSDDASMPESDRPSTMTCPLLKSNKAQSTIGDVGSTIDQERRQRPAMPRKQNSKTTRRSSVIKGYLEDETPLTTGVVA